jgi:hypothetical protein
MDADNSSAAEAALSTLSDALLDSATAPSARSEFLLEAANSAVHGDGVVVDGLQQGFHPLPGARKRRVDGGAAIFLGVDTVALLLGAQLQGHVLMGGDPAAVRHRPVGDGIDLSVAHLEGLVDRLALADLLHDHTDVVIDVARKGAILTRWLNRSRSEQPVR